MAEATDREREEGREKWKEGKLADIELLRSQGKVGGSGTKPDT